ncbi:DegT/DnrJ/EryC1/StrS family aminotransferase [Nocardia carnea]|uniref:DegT/DnrJ/EryC1/StrS family aminotransferase n=1 Tax=Nocardia carnea TaxID=37328 RepID=UPI0024571000|nr:DegT/DnrJ/EryC1/StrS aminotransferase family protein [Nocardia carnea]
MIVPFTAALPDTEIPAVLAAVEQILQSGNLVLGQHTEAFEARVAGMAGTRYAVAVNSGSTALEIIFRGLGVAGRTVLVPTNTNYATAAAALHAGARVQLYDAGLYPDRADIAARLAPDVAAVVVVHIGGYLSPDLPELARMCHRAGVALIEDAAHAHGARLTATPAGGFGTAAAWSFFATKVVTTGGEGGALTTDDPDLAGFARRCRNQGKDDAGHHVVAGNSWRMTEINAAIGAAQLDHLTRDVGIRREIVDRYAAALTGPVLTFPVLGREDQISGHKCVALLADGIDRAAVRTAATIHGMALARGVYDQPLHRQPVFADLNIRDKFPRADKFADRHLCLPLWRGMDTSTVEQVVTAVGAALRG